MYHDLYIYSYIVIITTFYNNLNIVFACMHMHECPKWVITTVQLQLTSARAPIVHAKACPVHAW